MKAEPSPPLHENSLMAIFVGMWRVLLNWWRVFYSAEASRIGQDVDQQLHKERCGQKNAWYCGPERGTGMRLIATVFCRHAPEAQHA
jgi:hypothetical protein